MWNLKCYKNDLIYKTETDIESRLLPGDRVGGVMDWEFGVSRCKLLMHRMDAKNMERNVYLCITE